MTEPRSDYLFLEVILIPCYHPLKALKPTEYELSMGERRYKFLHPDDYFYRHFENFYGKEERLALVPCGRCIGCRLEYSRQWAMRCLLESTKYKDNWFVTLTYDDEHLPTETFATGDFDTGEALTFHRVHSLVVKDLQDFKKRLLEHFRENDSHVGIRFFGCGEYGDKHFRPHYHVIFFNLPLNDLQVDKEYQSQKGYLQFISPLLEEKWRMGRVRVSEINFQTCAYVARYVMKKKKGQDASFYSENHLVPPFSIMSRKPGIARDYYEAHKDELYHYDSLVYHNGDRKTVISKPPRYFDQLFDLEQPDTMADIKSKRQDISEARFMTSLMNTDVSYFEQLLIKEDVQQSKIKSLLRVIG